MLKLAYVLLPAVILGSLAGAAPAQTGVQITGNSADGSSGSTTTGRGITGPGPGLATVPEDFAKLALEPGFLLSLNVLDDSDLTGSFRIDDRGNLVLPVLGALHLAGETASVAQAQIRERLLEERILKDPQVTLAVLEYTPPAVTIVGEVASPGKYPLLAPRKLVDVLALAGGTTLTAGDQVEIVHAGANTQPLLLHYSRTTDPADPNDVLVHPGDTVQVKRAGIVYVLGAVNRPGGYVMQEEGTLNVLQALALANGTLLAARTGKIHILRRNAGNGSIADIPVPYKKVIRGQLADVQLHAQDVVYVPLNKFTAVIGNGSAIFSSAASASIYAATIH